MKSKYFCLRYYLYMHQVIIKLKHFTILLTVKVTINCAEGCWHSKFIVLKTVTDIYLEQVTVQQHMNKIYYSERNKLLFKNTPIHSNQQLAIQLEHFCTKLLSDCKDFNPEIFSCTTSRYLLGQDVKISGASCTLLVTYVGT